MPDPQKQQSIQPLSGGRKGWEINAADAIIDKGKISWQNHTIQVQEAVHKPYTASTTSKNHEAVRNRSGYIIHKPHRLGMDT